MLEDDLRMTLKPLQWVVDLETAMFHQPPSRVVAAGRYFWIALIPKFSKVCETLSVAKHMISIFLTGHTGGESCECHVNVM